MRRALLTDHRGDKPDLLWSVSHLWGPEAELLQEMRKPSGRPAVQWWAPIPARQPSPQRPDTSKAGFLGQLLPKGLPGVPALARKGWGIFEPMHSQGHKLPPQF